MYQDYEAQNVYYPEHEYKPADSLYNPRLGFVRKVYGILCCQLLLTSIFTILCQGPLRPHLYNPYSSRGNDAPFAIFIFCSVVALITAIAIACYRSVARRVPTNYILLTVFTVAETYIVGYFTVFFEPDDVLLAAVLTLTMTITLTIYAFTTKRDFTVFGAALWIAGWALLAFSLLFFWIARYSAAYKPIVIVICVLSIVVYGFYLVFDTQLIIGGKRYELSMDDYVIGALMIYTDIIVLFMRILEIIGTVRRN